MGQSFRANTNTPVNNQPNAVVPALPITTQVKTLAEKFFDASGHNDSILNQVSVMQNGTINFNLINTGLVDKVLLLCQGAIPFKNTSGSPQTINLSPIFPYDTISNISVVFNGQVTVLTASPYELLALSNKRHKGGMLLSSSTGTGGYFQKFARVSAKKASLTAGTNLTLNAGDGLTGYNSVTVAASATGTLNYQFVVELPFVMRRDLPIGLLAMQNNSIICQVNMSAPAWLGTTPLSPCYVPSAIPSTLSFDPAAQTYLNCTPVQYFWETPADKNLYQYFVANSYMYISVPGQSFKSTGTQALQYQMPNNYILTGLLFTLRDANNALIDCYNNIQNPTLNYNNTTTVDKMPMAIRDYIQELYYEGTVTGLGQLIWDGTAVEYEANGLMSTSFLDMYKANNPQFFMDIASGVAVPGSFSVAREMIVPAQVKTA